MKKIRGLDLLYAVVAFVRFLLVCYVLAAIMTVFVVRREFVVGSSMHPTLKNEQSVLVNVANAYLNKVDRFDVVVVKNYENNTYWVKRVIGLPNETIAYKEDSLYINGKKVKESFLDQEYVNEIKQQQGLTTFSRDMNEVVLGSDEYFLVGDNRPASLDSRDPSVGAFCREQIIANGMMIISPIQDIKIVK